MTDEPELASGDGCKVRVMASCTTACIDPTTPAIRSGADDAIRLVTRAQAASSSTQAGAVRSDRPLSADVRRSGGVEELLLHLVRLGGADVGLDRVPAVPLASTMAVHAGVGITFESGNFVGPKSPFTSKVVFDGRLLHVLRRDLRLLLLQLLQRVMNMSAAKYDAATPELIAAPDLNAWMSSIICCCAACSPRTARSWTLATLPSSGPASRSE